MPDLLQIRRVGFIPASASSPSRTLLGYVSIYLAEIGRLDGLTLHRARSGGYGLNYPARKDGAGKRHPYFRPKNRATREAIERAVIEALRGRGVIQ